MEKLDLKNHILEAIKQQEIAPKSKVWFRSQQFLLWFLWFLATFLGAVAVAVSLSVWYWQRLAIYEITHPSFLSFLAEVLPSLWLLVFFLMLSLAVLDFRFTTRGYRHSLWLVSSGSLAVSVFLGSGLYVAGLGFTVDRWLGDYMVGYASQKKIEERIWQRPEEGRLVGVYANLQSPDGRRFIDGGGRAWRVDLTDLSLEEKVFLESGAPARLWGVVIPDNPPAFHICNSFPLSLTPDQMAEIRQSRERFLKKFEKVRSAPELPNIKPEGLCANLMVHYRPRMTGY
jgi:hypothetical protein